MSQRPEHFVDVESCVENTLQRLGKRISLGTPLGIGKANHLVNEFYRRAAEDPEIDLHIYTALTLGRPRWSSDLERRFVAPLAERLFGGYPELEYVDPLRKGELPDNIRVSEFYFQPGGFLKSPLAQQSYISSNYTHAVRDLLDAGVNVVAQGIAKDEHEGRIRYSLGSNPDLTVDFAPLLHEMERSGIEVALLGQVNREMPFMYGDAIVEPDFFHGVIDEPRYDFPLFPVPNRPVSTADYLLALHVSALIPDGGTIQIGIGSLGDAVTRVLQLRHQDNSRYLKLLDEAGAASGASDLIEEIGGTGTFEEGLYAASEMLVDGFLELIESGILKRRVYPHLRVQRLLNEGRITEDITPEAFETLAETLPTPLAADDIECLVKVGVLKDDTRIEDGELVLPDGTRLAPDLSDPGVRAKVASGALGDRLRGGHVLHGCFFVGPADFYEALRKMDPADRAAINMTGISFVNELFGEEELKRLQRKNARFINTGLICTLLGAVASDALEDGRVLSGVGGQYNFVAMAHALTDGRSILMIRATDEREGQVRSNIRWNYGHVTIPRHLRDIVVTEYGIAHLRGRSDAEVATSLIEIADSRFQDDLLKEARAAGKVPASYEIPDHARQNTPDRLDNLLDTHRASGYFDRFPFGTALTDEELTLKKALEWLKKTLKGRDLSLPSLQELRDAVNVPDSAAPYLERMDLQAPDGAAEVAMQRAVVFALSSTGALDDER